MPSGHWASVPCAVAYVSCDAAPGLGATLTLTLPESVRALASDPSARFLFKNSNPATVTDKAGNVTTSSSSCAGVTTYDSATGVLQASNCDHGTYSVHVVKDKTATSGQASSLFYRLSLFRRGFKLD